MQNATEARLSLCLDPGLNTCYEGCRLQACLFLIILGNYNATNQCEQSEQN